MNTSIADKHTLISAAEWFGGGRRWTRHSDVARWPFYHCGASRSARRAHPRACPGVAQTMSAPPGKRMATMVRCPA